MADGMEDLAWKTDLTLCLSKQPDLVRLRELCRGKKIPSDCRPELWKITLNVVGKPDALAIWDGLLDMNEQEVLKEDCTLQSAKLRLTEDDEEEVARDMEGLITFYCKSRSEKYRSTSGLVELLSPFITLNLPLSEVYNCFYAMQSRFIPRECYRDGKPFHLFRQLLQYHDPQLCSFLDSRKIPPDLYAQRWLRSLFVSVCDSDVTHAMWDIYFLESDPYFAFFLMLVMVLNAKDQILEMATRNKSAIIEMITNFPSQLGVDDIEDFCTLAQYYATRTPQSYRKEFQPFLFGSKITTSDFISNSLCLQVSIPELLESVDVRCKEDVRFFLVDCRPAGQYNNGHLPTAFHLDANLMLQAPSEFQTAVSALFATQQQAIEAGSNAGGEHLCFMGSGRESEDQYVNMVVANFLQRGTHFVSVAKGGYTAVHELLVADLAGNLVDHSVKLCIVCSPEASMSSEDESHELSKGDLSPTPASPKAGIVDKLSSSIRNRGADVKERLGRLITDSKQPQERHVSEKDKTGKRYRGVNLDIFSIEDPDDTVSSSGDEHETVNIDTWIKRSDVVRHFPCSEITSSGQMFSSYILLTSSHLFILREIVDKDRPGWAHIQSRPHLSSIVKITSKRKHPDLITFKYGTSDGEDFTITGAQRFLIPNSKQAMKKIKERILKVIN
ncbi:TBC1 domain family member 23-like [Hydractinia symbiolongicarpus]|uniref:TBC1 domain family member 23-like n=1 Tax=Hydractinia symbiolongicarpus TaxID=13093 RepID=UPI00254CA5C4|nr:TBC1 domain family member 23-like [Hydractinia symbiolongicarpus]